MRTCASESNRKARGLLVLAIILMAGLTFAQDGPVMLERQPTTEEVQARTILEYWTPERMRGARPKPFPEGLVTGAERESSVAAELPLDASVGYAPGWRPGRGPQPGPDAHIEFTPDDPLYEYLMGGEQLQTSPPLRRLVFRQIMAIMHPSTASRGIRETPKAIRLRLLASYSSLKAVLISSARRL
jgi:hypothetical protein